MVVRGIGKAAFNQLLPSPAITSCRCAVRWSRATSTLDVSHKASTLTLSRPANGGSGESDLTIPIHGPKGKAKIYAVATKSAGDWESSKLIVKVEDTGETIDLSEQATK
jgi:hypothetical protein